MFFYEELLPTALPKARSPCRQHSPDRQTKVCLYGELVRAIAHGHKRTSKRMPVNLSLNLDQATRPKKLN
jgi:hypothetical protein